MGLFAAVSKSSPRLRACADAAEGESLLEEAVGMASRLGLVQKPLTEGLR